MKISSDKQLKRDIKYLKKQLDDNKDAIDEILEHIEKVGIGSAESVSYTHLTLPTKRIV